MNAYIHFMFLSISLLVYLFVCLSFFFFLSVFLFFFLSFLSFLSFFLSCCLSTYLPNLAAVARRNPHWNLTIHAKNGADPGFSFRGGGRKRLYARTHITSAKFEVPFGRDPGPAGPGSSRFFYALYCYLSPIFKHSDTKWVIKNHSQSNFRGAPVAPPPLDPPLCYISPVRIYKRHLRYMACRLRLHEKWPSQLTACT